VYRLILLLFRFVSSFAVLSISCMYLHNRVGSTLPDGAYELVPQVEVKQEEQPQQEAVAPDQQLVDQSPAQAQGKHRSIHPILKVLATTVYVLVH
jgi:hypothetical protein